MVKNKILIVDDEVFNLDLLEYALESLHDIVITRASNAAMALDILQNSKQDLIILDISMPGMTGLEMLQKLKLSENTKYIPVIMVTAKNEERHNALKSGSEDFLAKPIDTIELKFKVNNLLKLKKFNDLQQHFNQRLKEEVQKKQQELEKLIHVEQELSMAKDIQQGLLPKSYPTKAGLEIYGSCTQAHDIGGDYYDVFETECGNYTLFIIADVSGHGLSSALIAMQFRTLV
ncbi:MAG TPA: response regulator, partial [Sulfurospirillum arcachonense]|nr:response regulator [Sulfurospirillum arcachonense]